MKKYNHNYHQDRAKDQEDHEEEIDEPNHPRNDQTIHLSHYHIQKT